MVHDTDHISLVRVGGEKVVNAVGSFAENFQRQIRKAQLPERVRRQVARQEAVGRYQEPFARSGLHKTDLTGIFNIVFRGIQCRNFFQLIAGSKEFLIFLYDLIDLLLLLFNTGSSVFFWQCAHVSRIPGRIGRHPLSFNLDGDPGMVVYEVFWYIIRFAHIGVPGNEFPFDLQFIEHGTHQVNISHAKGLFRFEDFGRTFETTAVIFLKVLHIIFNVMCDPGMDRVYFLTFVLAVFGKIRCQLWNVVQYLFRNFGF